MGMRDDIQRELAAAFDTDLADAVRSFTGTRPSDGAGYDPDTGTTTPGLTYTGRGVFGGYDSDNVDGSRVLMTDTRLLVLQNEITAAPHVTDRIGTQSVISVGQDPAAATWVIQLRG